ncbi:MAG: hypothetical protein Q4B22_06105 [Eubacteriales bacterium]|nr:hypothetical protein [Eubacteriales bacterium]
MNTGKMNAAPAAEERMDTFQVEMESVAKIESPYQMMETLLATLGEKYPCERIYIFEKNAEGNYDCNYEWVAENVFAKQHLLQNLTPNAVSQYYQHFAINPKLIVRNLEELAKDDYPLYKLLRAQNLQSLIVEQLIFEGKDRGFIGIDNPNPNVFDELLTLFDFISYFISLQGSRRRFSKRLNVVDKKSKADRKYSVSLYDRISDLTIGKPLGVICCSIVLQGVIGDYSTGSNHHMLSYAEKMLVNMFGQASVFNLGKNEFLIIYEESKKQTLEEIEYYLEMAGKAFDRLNTRFIKGVVSTLRYENDFFEMLNIARTHMLRDKKKFQEMYAGKYHTDDGYFTFNDLIEIRPERKLYKVLYSEYLKGIDAEGSLTDFIKQVTELVVEEERDEFLAFCQSRIKKYRTNTSLIGEPYSENFRLYAHSGGTENIAVVVLHYKDNQGESVLMCYTR